METLRAAPEAVTETAIFSALSPQHHAPYRRPDAPRPRSSSSTSAAGGVIFPRVGPARLVSPGPSGDALFLSGSEVMLPPKTPRSLLTSVPITANECTIVWRFLCDWVTAQLAMEAPATIPGFGTITLKTQPAQRRVVVFDPERAFLNNFALQTTNASCHLTHSQQISAVPSEKNAYQPPVLRKRNLASSLPSQQQGAFSYMEMAACCTSTAPIDAAKAQEWLQSVIQKIGEAMNQCKQVELNLRVGILTCIDATIESQLASQHSIIAAKPSRSGEVRQVENVRAQPPPQQGLRPTQQQSVPTPEQYPGRGLRSSFLTSGDFSPAIQLHPVIASASLECSQRPPHRPPSYGGRSNNTSSPRSQQLLPRQIHSPRERGVDGLLEAATSSRVNTDDVTVEQNPDQGEQTAGASSLFDSLSRTLCVEPDQNLCILVPSNRIGANFSEAAKRLVAVNFSGDNRADSSKLGVTFIVFDKLRSAALNDNSADTAKSAVSSETRYFECLRSEVLIDPRYLAPLSSAIARRVVAAAVKYLPSTRRSTRLVTILDGEQRQMTENYYASVRKAILDYLLLRRETRVRLGIMQGVPPHITLPSRWKWGDSAGANGCIPDLKLLTAGYRGDKQPVGSSRPNKQPSSRSWDSECVARRREQLKAGQAARKLRRKKLEAKLAANLLLTDPRVQWLQALWFDMEASLLLVNLPDTEELNATDTPLGIAEFVRDQLDHATRMKAQLQSCWHDKARAIIINSPGDRELDAPRKLHLMNTVATLMSIQLRSLVEKSIARYLAFFERFAVENSVKTAPAHGFGLLASLILQTQSAQSDASSPAQDVTINFRDPLHKVPSCLLSVLHNLLKLFQDVPRIEAQWVENTLPVKHEALLLWSVVSREEEIVAATIHIRKVVEQNLGGLRDLQALYQSFALQFQQIAGSRAVSNASQPNRSMYDTTSQLEALRDAIKHAQTTARSLQAQVTNLNHLNLFAVDCRDVNVALTLRYSVWVSESLAAFQQRTSEKIAQLSRVYKDIATRLARRPANLDELLEAEAFVTSLKKRRLVELQGETETIKEYVRFLLFDREIIHIAVGDAEGVDQQTENNGGDSPTDIEKSSTARSSGFSVSEDLLARAAKTFQWHPQIMEMVRETDATLMGERARIEASFVSRRTLLLAEIDEFEDEVKALAKKGDFRHAATNVMQLGKMKEALATFRKTAEAIAIDEGRLQLAMTDFGKLDDVAEAMEPYEQLWWTAREFREMSSRWLRGNVFELPGAEGLTALMQMLGVVTNVSKRLQMSAAGAALIAEMLRKQMTEFRENIRLVLALSNAAMKDRHMSEVAALLGVPEIETRELVTLLKLLENGAYERIPRVVEISESASQQLAAELALAEIAAEWTAVRIEFKPNTNCDQNTPVETGDAIGPTSALAGPSRQVNDIRMLILDKLAIEGVVSLAEDHTMRLQTLSCMPCAVPFADQIASWLTFSERVRSAVDVMVTNERAWRYLSPIFASGLTDQANSKQTPTESSSNGFAEADALYKSIMQQIAVNPTICSLIHRPDSAGTSTDLPGVVDPEALETDIMPQLYQCRDLLDAVKETVRVGVESTRASFSRFNFLTDTDLVMALSCTSSSPWTSSPSFWKIITRGCFPGVHGVALNGSGDIIALVSSVGEYFPLGAPITTKEASIASCLAKMETAMVTILQASVRAALGDLPRKEFRKWCLLWPEQVLQAAILLSWTLQGEGVNFAGAADASAEWAHIAAELTDKQVSVSKELKAAALSRSRISLSNVIALLVQLRDVSQRISNELAGSSQERAGSDTSLAWLAQPRLYYEGSILSLRVMASAPLLYGFEYLGNVTDPPLVTPLTLRCYHAIAQTAGVVSSRGVLLEGPPGVGKTTIAVGLARLSGRLSVSFEAVPGLTGGALAAERFVRGSAMCGAWLTLRHLCQFNAPQVSALVTLCSQVRNALAAGSTQCVLAGRKVRLHKGMFFLASSLTISGSTASFPEEARFFFRRLVVSGLDVAYIAEALFTLNGFQDACSLSRVVYAALSAFDRGVALSTAESRQNQRDMALTKTNMMTFGTVKRVVARAAEIRRACVESMDGSPDCRVGMKCVHLALYELLSFVSPAASSISIERFLLDLTASANPSASILNDTDQSAQSNGMAQTLATKTSTRISNETKSSEDLLTTDLNESPPPIHVQSVEVQVEQRIRSNRVAEIAIFGAAFVSKSLQLLQAMQSHRAVVVVGEIGSGKTSVYRSLATTLSELSRQSDTTLDPIAHMTSEIVDRRLAAPTRVIAMCPRALTLTTLLGQENYSCGFGDTVLGKIVRDSKRAFKTEQGSRTWLIMDGDVDASWGDQVISLAHDSALESTGTSGLPKGMPAPGGKFVTLPVCTDVIFETMTLSDASPSFLTRAALISMGSPPVLQDWRGLYSVWKSQHVDEFAGVTNEIYSLVDDALEETLDASLKFVEESFEHATASSRLIRIQSLLAYLDSFLRVALPKLRSMISIKQRRMACCCFYIQALVWGVGSTIHSGERQKFHAFLRHLIIYGPASSTSMLKRTLVLFFPSSGDTQAGTVARLILGKGSMSSLTAGSASSGSAGATTSCDTIYCYAFSVEFGLKWMRWSEYYESWRQQVGAPAPIVESSSTTVLASLWERHPTKVMVPTPSHAATVCLMHQLLMAHYPAVLIGPPDGGKSMVMTKMWQLVSGATRNSSRSEWDGSYRGNAVCGTASRHSADLCHKIYASASTSASSVLYQLDPLLKIVLAAARANERSRRRMNINDTTAQEPTRFTYVFIDDMHCMDGKGISTMDNAAEVIRMMTEHSVVVEPERKVLVPCKNFVLAGAAQAQRVSSKPSQSAVARLVRKCIPVAIPRLSDTDLASICSALTAPFVVDTADQPTTGGTQMDGSPSALQPDASQLHSTVLKASLKLFRMLASAENTVLMRMTSLTPRKLLYNYRSDDLLALVLGTCAGLSHSSAVADKPMLARRWCHESARVFGDRLLDQHEQSSFYQQLQLIALSSFGLTADTFFPASMDTATMKTAAKTQAWMSTQLQFTFVGENSGVGYVEGYREVSDLQKIKLSIERSIMAMFRHHESIDSRSKPPAALEILLCDYVVRHVLRLCRVLRVTGQPALLLGQRGCKMVTIVRLAAFICKMPVFAAQPVRLEASASDDTLEVSSWSRVWKRAITAAIHQVDTKVVLVVKEACYDSQLINLPQLEALNQFLGGFGLPPDVIAYEDLSRDDLIFLREAYDLQSTHPRPGTAHDGDATTSGSSNPQTTPAMESKRSMLSFLFALLREKLQIVVVMQSHDAVATLAWQYPNLVKLSAVCCIDDCPLDSLSAIAQKCFLLSPMIDKERAVQLAAATVGIYDSTKQFIASSTCDYNTSVQSPRTSSVGSKGNGGSDNLTNAPCAPRSTWYDRPSRFTQIDPAMLIDHIGLILSYWDGMAPSIRAEREKYAAGLAFLDDTEQLLLAEQSHAKLLRPEMQRKLEIRRRMSGNLEREKITASKITRGLEVATDLVEVQRGRLATIEREYMELIHDTMVSFQRTKEGMVKFRDAAAIQDEQVDLMMGKKIEQPSVQETAEQFEDEKPQRSSDEQEPETNPPQPSATLDEEVSIDGDHLPGDPSSLNEPILSESRRLKTLIKSFVSILHAPTSLRQLAECIGLIMGIEPVEARDEMDPEEIVMDYWKSLTAHMQTPEFWEDLVTYDASKRVNEKMVALLLPICMAPDFEKDMFGAVHELAGVLCEWVQACALLARDLVLASPKLAQLEHEREAFAEAQTQVAARSQELRDQVDTTLMQVNAQRLVSEMERRDIEDKLRSNTSTLEMTSSVWKVLQTSRAKWRRQYEYYTELAAQWIGDLLLATATIAYASSLSSHVRATLRGNQWWSKVLAQHFLSHSLERPIHKALMMSGTELERLGVDGLPTEKDECTRENVVIALKSYRLPVLMDPHGIAVEWLQNYRNNVRSSLCTVSSLSATSSQIWKVIRDSVETDSLIVVTDFCERVAQDLSSFIAAKRRALFSAMNRDIVGHGGSSAFGSENHRTGEGFGYQRHRCWCYQPVTSQGTPSSCELRRGGALSSSTTDEERFDSSLFEFSSDRCRVFFIYSKSKTMPAWMATYQSYLTIIQFELTSAFVKLRSMQTIVEASGNSHALTEIDALQLDMRTADAQADVIESELLSFLSNHTAGQVCNDAASALKIVANRNAWHTLQQGRVESFGKIQAGIARLDLYSPLIKRCQDVVRVWRDTANFLAQVSRRSTEWIGSAFSLNAIWSLLTKAVQGSGLGVNVGVAMATFTSKARQFVTICLQDEDHLVFNFLLAFYIYQRSAASDILHETSALTGAKEASETARLRAAGAAVRNNQEGQGLILHLLGLAICGDSIATGKGANSKLFKLRPEGVSKPQWQALCFIAEGSPALQQFVTRSVGPNAASGESSSLRKVVAAAQASASSSSQSAQAKAILRRLAATSNPLFRLCIRVALDRDSFLSELDEFVNKVLDSEHETSFGDAASRNEGQSPDVAESASGERGADITLRPRSRGSPTAHCGLTEHSGSSNLLDIWQSFSGPHCPIIVVTAAPDVDVLRLIKETATQARATVDTNCSDALLANNLGMFEQQLVSAAGKGYWVVIRHAHTLRQPSHVSLVDRLTQMLDGQQHRSDFRLWVSALIPSMDRKYQEVLCSSSRIVADEDVLAPPPRLVGAYTTCGSGHYSMKRALSHAMSLLQYETARGFALVANEKQAVVRLGVYHALVVSRAELLFAQWKLTFEFGDADLVDAIHALLALLPQRAKRVVDPADESSSAVDTDDEGPSAWSNTVLQAVVDNLYCSKVRETHDAALLRCCFDVVFGCFNEDMQSQVLPEARSILRELRGADLDHIHEVISTLPEFPGNASKLAASDHQPKSEPPSRLPHLGLNYDLPSECQRALAVKIATVLIDSEQGDLVPPSGQRSQRLMPLMAAIQGHETSADSPPLQQDQLDTLSKFRNDLLELAIVTDALQSKQSAESVNRPLQDLVRNEMNLLQHARRRIAQDIGHILAIASRVLPLDPLSLSLVSQLAKNRVSRQWLELVAPFAITDSTDCIASLEAFKVDLMQRLQDLALWLATELPPKIPLTHFQSSQAVFEAIHQHLKHSLEVPCCCTWTECLSVVSIRTDSATLAAPTTHNSVFVNGTILVGLLRLDIDSQPLDSCRPVDAHLDRKKRETVVSAAGPTASEFSCGGVSVVLEVTSACTTRHSGAKGTTDSHLTTRYAFHCPVYRDGGSLSRPQRAEATISVLTTTPLAQLVLSGSALCVPSLE